MISFFYLKKRQRCIAGVAVSGRGLGPRRHQRLLAHHHPLVESQPLQNRRSGRYSKVNVFEFKKKCQSPPSLKGPFQVRSRKSMWKAEPSGGWLKPISFLIWFNVFFLKLFDKSQPPPRSDLAGVISFRYIFFGWGGGGFSFFDFPLDWMKSSGLVPATQPSPILDSTDQIESNPSSPPRVDIAIATAIPSMVSVIDSIKTKKKNKRNHHGIPEPSHHPPSIKIVCFFFQRSRDLIALAAR